MGALRPAQLPPPVCLAGNAQNTLAQPAVWLTIALTTVVCILPVVAFRFLRLSLRPDLSDTVSLGAVETWLAALIYPPACAAAAVRAWCGRVPVCPLTLVVGSSCLGTPVTLPSLIPTRSATRSW